MSDLLEKCEVCGGLLDEEDLFCATCGRSVPLHESAGETTEVTSTHNFECSGCGASMSYDASAQNLRCPFCGADGIERREDAKVLLPQSVVPFLVDRQRAEQTLRAWLGKGFWRPGDLRTAAIISRFTHVYVPYWVFAAKTHTYWTADSSRVPFGAKSSWHPVSGEHRSEYGGLLVGASSVLSPSETSALCPFDLRKGVQPSQVDLRSVTVEQFTVHRKYARPLARQGVESHESDACARQYLPGGHRNLRVNVRMERLRGEPVLLPVWVMAYRYRGQLYRFLLNGQTGNSTGEAPVSRLKIGGAILLVIVLLIIMFIVSSMM